MRGPHGRDSTGDIWAVLLVLIGVGVGIPLGLASWVELMSLLSRGCA